MDETADGYLVHLFNYQFAGCGPHTTSAFDLLVTGTGEVRELSVKGMFEDPAEDTLCID